MKIEYLNKIYKELQRIDNLWILKEICKFIDNIQR